MQINVRDVDTKKKSIFILKPIDWGKGTEKSSSEIDKLLYGTSS